MKISKLSSMAALLGIAVPLTCSVFCAGAAEKEPNDNSPSPVYSVAAYDPDREPAEDLNMTIEMARQGNKRIMLVVGGDWCIWCHLMADYFKENPKVASALANDFVIMKVNMSQKNRNEEFLSKYPKTMGYPHIYVLESDGKFLHSQGTAVLEEGRGYNEKAVLEFLAKWAPSNRDRTK